MATLACDLSLQRGLIDDDEKGGAPALDMRRHVARCSVAVLEIKALWSGCSSLFVEGSLVGKYVEFEDVRRVRGLTRFEL